MFAPAGQLGDRTAEIIAGMMARMYRRGPDDSGQWADAYCRLGFRRLAILDLSPAAHQPMVSADGRGAIVFNGELYNFADIRQELEAHGVRFRSTGDTEVVLEALNRWGAAALERFNGMFALAWYDIPGRRVLLARDHAGIKPLYYSIEPNSRRIAFASQFNCLMDAPWSTGELRGDVLRLFLRLHHIPPPYTLYKNIHQLEPGHFVLFEGDGTQKKRGWWQMERDVEPDLEGEPAREALAEVLDSAVRRHRISDVPLGVFLSGGVDSPLVAAVARAQAGPSLKAFTIGNPGWRQDESADAARYAGRLDVDHRVTNVSAQDAMQAIGDVAAAQPEPFADFSVVPTLLVSQAARNEVVVALSGDGGDELFFGYTRPVSLLRNGEDFRWPRPVRMGLYAAGKWGFGPKRSSVIVSRSPADYYFNVNSRMSGEDVDVLAPDLPPIPPDFTLYSFDRYQGRRHLAGYSRFVEFYGQLSRGLKKVDIASMHHSLEVRVPLLDREVIRVAMRINPFDSMRNGGRKTVLRDLLERYVPPQEIPTAKRGFAVPLGEWLRGPLKPVVEDVLFSGPAFPEGLWDRKALRLYWEDHLKGTRDLKWAVWNLLALQWWKQAHASPARAADAAATVIS